MAPTPSQDTIPTETSPLLPRPDVDARTIDPGNAVATGGAEALINSEHGERDVEQQAGNGDATARQGLPEVRKRLKYILPAMGIGVSFYPFPIP